MVNQPLGRGSWGRLLAVDLSTRQMETEALPLDLLHDLIGGYGLGAHLLLERMPAGTAALAEESLLGFLTGPLTGTPILTGCRFTVVGRSPLTNTWGDANCGGYFGPALKMAGYDGALIQGKAESPVYLLLTEDGAAVLEASDLWGLDTYETEVRLRIRHGREARVACIGPAGESRSLIAAIMSDMGRAAGRSGLGALMGSKNLKAIVAQGNRPVPVADAGRVEELRRATVRAVNRGFGAADFLRATGTPGYTLLAVHSGDAPIKNWSGTPADLQGAEALSPAVVNERRVARYACYRCPIACGGWWQAVPSEKGQRMHQPEYETMAAFGPLCLNTNLDSIAQANDLCNRYGLDTISTGSAVAFAIECYQNGLLDSHCLDGLQLSWGDPAAIVSLTSKIARREAFGAVLADGLEAAVRELGPASRPLAVHVRGEALPLHDPRFEPGLAVIYALDATPARHTQANQMEVPAGLGWESPPRGQLPGRGHLASRLSNMIHVVNSSGLCLHGLGCMTIQDFAASLAAVTGWARDLDKLEELGKGIGDLRQAFNTREGIVPAVEQFPGRALHSPPTREGPWSGQTIELEPMAQEYLQAMGWDSPTADSG
jgi:aldehyde:ferredoxin oxidoreductase